ncbi:MAG: glutamine amidotransferase, partial [Thermoleophilia bacterium]
SWGCLIKAELFDGEKCLSQAQDVFAVGTNPFRLGQESSWAGDLPQSSSRLFEGDNAHWPTQWREMKGTWLEIYCGQPTEFVGLETDWDQWITMQDRYRRSKKAIRAYTGAAHRLGMKVMMYNNATPSGWVGAAWGRKHPEWLAYNYMGSMLGHAAKLYVEDLEKMKSWHKTMDPGERPAERWRGFQPFLLAVGSDSRLVDFGCDQMLSAGNDLGYDGVRFDGHWTIGQFWTTLGYDIKGRRLNRGASVDAANTGITRQMKNYIGKRKPDFRFGYNYGLNYEYAAAKSPEEFREACSDGGMILFEGAMFDGSHSEWRTGALAMREAALRVHQNGGILFGQARMLHARDTFPVNDFSLRYLLITNFAATSHIYGGVYSKHPSYLPLQGTYYRFALRYGELLYDEKLCPIQNPQRHLSVTVDGKEHPDLWWKMYTYKRPLNGKYQIITHLVNMPAPGITKTTSTIDKQPLPIKDVILRFPHSPTRVFLLDPEAEPWIDDRVGATSLTIPKLKSWKVVVQEFPGSCNEIPAEVFPVPTFEGKDFAPDPKDGKIVFPVAGFARGEEGTRLAKDEQALFGHALYCKTDRVAEPVFIMDGPRQECGSITAPGRARVTFRLKVADNASSKPVFDVSGPFGTKMISGNAFKRRDTYQKFAYDYDVEEGVSGYMTMRYYGGTGLWVDAVLVEQLAVAKDRDRFSVKELALGSLPARVARTGKAHVVRGLWHEYFGMDDAFNRTHLQPSSSWAILSSHQAYVPSGFPATAAELLKYDLVALLNIAADELRPTNRKNLREYVYRGGTLFVVGGARAFGHGGYKNTFLADILPVEVTKYDLEKAVGEAQLITVASSHELTKGVLIPRKAPEDPFSFANVSGAAETSPRNVYYHKVRVKPRATVLLTAGDQPILTVWKFGQGTVYAMTGTPLGELPKDGGVPWWEWEGWKTILDRIINKSGALPQSGH